MSESNGKPAASPYRRAVERHKAERAAWQRVRDAQAALRAAVHEYNTACLWADRPPQRSPGLTLAQAAGFRDDPPDSETLPAAELDGLRTDVILPTLEETLAAEADAELADEGLTAEAAELPAGGEPRVAAFVEREKAEAKEKRAEERANRHFRLPDGGWTEKSLDAAGRKLAGKDRSLESLRFCADCGTLRVPSRDFRPCPACGQSPYWEYHKALELRPPKFFPPTQQPAASGKRDPEAGLDQATADGLPPWTSEDLDRELLHALGQGGLAAHMAWGALIRNGATNPEIDAHLGGLWPRSRKTVPPNLTGTRKLGYTIIYAASQPAFWLGPFRGPGHRPTLANAVLIDRIRRILEIPTPAQAQKAAQDSFREVAVRQGIPMNPPAVQQKRPGGPRFVACPIVGCPPAEGWDDAELRNAAEDLGVPFVDLAICVKCAAVRDHVVHPCPNCQSPHFNRTDSPAVWGTPEFQPKRTKSFSADPPAAEPVRRGPGRPKGSKTRKAVEA